MIVTPAGRIPSAITDMPVANLNDVDKLLIAADYTLMDGKRHAGVIGAAMFRIIKSNPYIGLPYLEKRLRALKSDTYLIAAPIRVLPKDMISRLLKNDKPAKHFIWIGVNGKDDAKRMLSKYNMTSEENINLLSVTGFLFPKVVKQASVTSKPVPNLVPNASL